MFFLGGVGGVGWGGWVGGGGGTHYNDITKGSLANPLCLASCSGQQQRKQPKVPFVRGLLLWPVDFSFKVSVLGKCSHVILFCHYSNTMMSVMASQITGFSVVCSAVCSCENQRKYQSSTSLAFVRGIHQRPVDSPHKGPVRWNRFPFDDIIMVLKWGDQMRHLLQVTSKAAFTLYATRRDMTRRDAIWRDIQVLFTLCATSSRAVTWQQGIWDPEQIKLGNLNGCFDPTWHCVYLTDIPQKITSIRITQPHKHITWNTNSSHWWVLIKVCWGVNPVCVNSTSHVTLNQAS